MPSTKYLIIGSSHAGLSALDAIRLQDTEGSVTLVTRDENLPYSPTILPYVVSGDADPETIFLRDEKVENFVNRFRRCLFSATNSVGFRIQTR